LESLANLSKRLRATTLAERWNDFHRIVELETSPGGDAVFSCHVSHCAEGRKQFFGGFVYYTFVVKNVTRRSYVFVYADAGDKFF